MYIWFNLLLFSSGHWMYVETLETLEECQELKIWYENVHPGDYYCRPTQIQKS